MNNPESQLAVSGNIGPVAATWTGPAPRPLQKWRDARRRKRYANVMSELLPRIGETIRVNVPAVDAYTDLEYEVVRRVSPHLISHMIEQQIECLLDDDIREGAWNSFVGAQGTHASILLSAIRSYPDIAIDDGNVFKDLSEIELASFIPRYEPVFLADGADYDRITLLNMSRGNKYEIERCCAEMQVLTNDIPAFIETVAITASAILQIQTCGHGAEAKVLLVVDSSMGIISVQVTNTTISSNVDLPVSRSPGKPQCVDVDAKSRALRRYGLIKSLISGSIYDYHVSETPVVVMAVSDMLRYVLRQSSLEDVTSGENCRIEVHGFLENISTFCRSMSGTVEMAVKTCGGPTGKEIFLDKNVRLKIHRAVGNSQSHDIKELRKRVEPGREVRNRVKQVLRNAQVSTLENIPDKRFILRDCYVSKDVSNEVSLLVLQAVKEKLRRSLKKGERQAGSFLEIYVKRQLLDNELTEADRDRLVGHRRYETYQDTGSELAVCLPDRDIMLVYPRYSELDYLSEPKQIASTSMSREAVLTIVMLPKFLDCSEQDELVDTICDEAKKSVRMVIENRSRAMDASFLRVVSDKGIRLSSLCERVYRETRDRDYLHREWMIREVLAYAASLGVGPTVATESTSCYVDAVMAIKGAKTVVRKLECDRPVGLDGAICYKLEYDEHGKPLEESSSTGAETAKRVMLAVEGNGFAVEVQGYKEAKNRATGLTIGTLKLSRNTGRLKEHMRQFLAKGMLVA